MHIPPNVMRNLFANLFLMNKLIILLFPFFLFNCKPIIYKVNDIAILKNLYAFPAERFRLDTISNFSFLTDFIYSKDANLDLKPCTLEGGFIYNLEDSTFVPSPDTTKNIVFTCIQRYPNCPSFYGIYGHIFKISNIINDSLTIQIVFHASEISKMNRISIGSLDDYFTPYIDTVFNQKLSQSIPTVFLLNVSKNPKTKDIQEIFNTLFWSYNSHLLSRFYIDLEQNGIEVDSLINILNKNGTHLSDAIPPFEFWFTFNDGIERYLK